MSKYFLYFPMIFLIFPCLAAHPWLDPRSRPSKEISDWAATAQKYFCKWGRGGKYWRRWRQEENLWPRPPRHLAASGEGGGAGSGRWGRWGRPGLGCSRLQALHVSRNLTWLWNASRYWIEYYESICVYTLQLDIWPKADGPKQSWERRSCSMRNFQKMPLNLISVNRRAASPHTLHTQDYQLVINWYLI